MSACWVSLPVILLISLAIRLNDSIAILNIYSMLSMVKVTVNTPMIYISGLKLIPAASQKKKKFCISFWIAICVCGVSKNQLTSVHEGHISP